MSTEVHDLIEGTEMHTYSLLFISSTVKVPLLVIAGTATGQVSTNIFVYASREFILFVEIALSPNNNLVHIYANHGGKWQLESVLKEVLN